MTDCLLHIPEHCRCSVDLKLASLKAENQRLRELLAKHGRHESGCYHGLRGMVCNCVIGRYAPRPTA